MSDAIKVDTSIFKSYDIRGIYGSQIHEQNIGPIIEAIYGFLQKSLGKTTSLTVVLGRDMRVSSPSLFQLARDTLVRLGASVVDIGLVSTPTFYFSVYHYHYDCGIQITASHNPKEYNGIKFVRNSPNGLIKIGKSTGMETVKEMVVEGYSGQHVQGGGVGVRTDVLGDEVENALSLYHHPKLQHYKIVADTANAMGATYIDAIFRMIPAELIRMNFELDGTFPVHQPDPLNYENLRDLQSRVLTEKADFGLAPDGDGDRLFFIDELGAVVPASSITALIARELLQENMGGLILFDIRYILTPQKVVEASGGRFAITKVGHAFITEQMGNTGAIFAGESSAHYFYKATGNAESQVVTIITVLKALTESGKTLSQLVKELQHSFESGEINFEVQNAQAVLSKIKAKYASGELSTLDGIAISYPTWRFSLRTSNTEPLLRLNLEATTRGEMEKKKEELVNMIQSLAKT